MPFFSKIRLIAGLAIALACSAAANANESIVVVGKARMEYAKINQGAYREVFYLAKVNALEQVAAAFPQAKFNLFANFREELTSFDAIDLYVMEAVEVGKTIDTGKTKDKSLRLAVSAKINLTALDVFFHNKSEAGMSTAGVGSDFGVFFIARKMVANKRFKIKETTVSENKAVSSGNETATVDAGTTSLSSASSEMNLVSNGGSVQLKADENQYEVRLDLTEGLAAAIKQHLVDAGYEPLSSDDLVDAGYDGLAYLDEIVEQGMIGPEGMMPRRLFATFKKSAIEEGWKFFGAGRVDVGMAQKDDRTGGIRVPATVTFEVFMDVDGKSRSVAVVAPEVVWGESEAGDAAVAEQLAQNGAVDKAMQTIIAQMQLKQLK